MRAAEAVARARRYEPWIVVSTLVVVQWVALAILTTTIPHNGWLFYQGGDQTWFYTSAWELGNGRIPESLVGYVWPFFLAPLTWVAGPNFLDGLPVIVLFQVVVLLPLGVICAYAVAARLGGRLLGYWAAAGWVVAPYAVIPLFVDRYHERWNDQTLPQVFGLTGLADFPSMIFLLVAAVFVMRALDGGTRSDVLAAAVVTGTAVGLKTSNGLFVFAPLVAFALARRWRACVEFAAVVTPFVVTLALWKYRGNGIAILALDERVLAAAEPPPPPPPHPSELSTWERARAYVPIDIHQINQQFLGFREYFWSARLLEYLPVAGAIALARRSVPKTAFFAMWLAAFFVVKASSEAVNVETASIWRLLMPAWPAYFFLAISLPLLVPVWGRVLPERFTVPWHRLRWHRGAIAVALVVGVVPLVGILALRPSDGDTAAKLPLQTLFLPIREDFGLSVVPVEGGLQLEWQPRDAAGGDSFYIVYRSPLRYSLTPTDPRIAVEGRLCEPTDSVPRCTIEMREIGRTREPRFLDRPDPGEWTYRVGLAANWRNDESLGDTFVISRPFSVSVQ
jgi:hypothetical protein